MKIEKVKIDELISPEYNPREISSEEMEKLKRSIEEFGYVDPIIVNDVNMHIVGGNQRAKALKQLGYDEVDVIFINEPNIHKEKALNIRLNNLSGEWDNEKLEIIIEEIQLNEPELINIIGHEPIQITENEENYEFTDENETIKEYELPKEVFKLLITFDNETDQENYYNKFIEEGLDCRILTL